MTRLHWILYSEYEGGYFYDDMTFLKYTQYFTIMWIWQRSKLGLKLLLYRKQ
jgi:hypothetical protein